MKTKIAAAVALACLSSAALAQSSKMGVDAGWYIGAHLGRSTTSFSSNDFDLTALGVTTSKEEHDTAWKLLLGYNFDQNWALEGFYTMIGEPKVKYTGVVGGFAGTGEAKVRNDSWGLAIKGTIPVHAQWDIYGRLGWTYNRSEMNASFTAPALFGVVNWGADHNRSDAVLGAGVEWKPQKNWGIRLEYENYGRFGDTLNTVSDTGRTDSDMWSLGVVVRF